MFEEVVRNGSGTHKLEAFANSTMRAYPAQEISQPDFDQMRDWLQGLPKPVGVAAQYADYCASCHAPDGKGGVLVTAASSGMPAVVTAYASAFHSAPFANKADNLELPFVRSGTGGSAADRRSFMPQVPVATLSDSEVNAILAWAHMQ
jgi:hypothetical protein